MNDRSRRNLLRAGTLSLTAGALPALHRPAFAQGGGAEPFPTRAVRLVVPFTAGGPTDVLARLLAERLTERWKQPVIVDNRPGAGSVIGTQAVARAPADGHTLGLVVMAHVVNPSLRRNLPYDTLKDFTAISQLTTAACALVVHPSVPATTVPDFIRWARQRPGGVAYATPGIGTLNHMAGALLASRAGIDLVHVPYAGSAAAHADVLSGRVPMMFDVWAPVKEFVRAGRLKVLGVTTPQRIADEPAIPSIAETLPGFDVVSAFGVVAPAPMPAALVERLGADVGAVVREPAVAARIREFGMEPVGSSPRAYRQFIHEQVARRSKVVAENRIEMQ